MPTQCVVLNAGDEFSKYNIYVVFNKEGEPVYIMIPKI
jgi:hypothetical protein